MSKLEREIMSNNGKRIHFVGIGGTGMSGIASIMLELGYQISGSDLNSNISTKRLIDKGALIYEGHDGSHVLGANLVVISSAIKEENQEVIAAYENNIEVIPRAEMLARLMNQKYRIAISGTHGKTSTTSMISLILEGMNLDPTIAIGGEVNDIGGNAKLGRGDYVVVEADESDGSFLLLNPNVAIITNIENDHLDYYTNLEKTMDCFKKFIEKVPREGCIVYGMDCPNTRTVVEKMCSQKQVISFGFHPSASIRAINTQLSGNTSTSDIYFKKNKLGILRMNIPGHFNVSNALAAIATCMELGLKFDDIAEILYHFKGVKRRQEIILKQEERLMIIDDYGHHPSEIKATLKGMREGWPEYRIITVFQPHRYSRTQLLLESFGSAFQDSHMVIINDIYAANEKPVSNISAELVYKKVSKEHNGDVYYLPGIKETIPFLKNIISHKDIVITMGAGDVWKIGVELARDIEGFK